MRKTYVGNITSLFISQKDSKDRKQKSILHLNQKGIIQDKFYNKDILRSVLITSKESYNLAKLHHISMPYGLLGENILIDYNPYHLASGTRFLVGTCILEITQNCTLCNHLSSIDNNLPTLLKKDRGIFAKVIQSGHIKKKDKIFILS